MSAVLVDTNVLLDIFTEDPVWFEWSRAALAEAAASSPLVINPIIYAEASVHFHTKEDLDEALPSDHFRREPLRYDAAFLAAKAHLQYRRRGGRRHAPLPGFFIGAQAVVAGYTVLTRDPRRYRTYFPTLKLIAPA